MKSYSSFLVRWWLVKDKTKSERTVLDIEHIQTGARHKGVSIVEAEHWMLNRCQKSSSEPDELSD